MGRTPTGKEKLSIYLSSDERRKLTGFCKKHHGANHSTVIANALELLYAREEYR